MALIVQEHCGRSITDAEKITSAARNVAIAEERDKRYHIRDLAMLFRPCIELLDLRRNLDNLSLKS